MQQNVTQNIILKKDLRDNRTDLCKNPEAPPTYSEIGDWTIIDKSYVNFLEEEKLNEIKSLINNILEMETKNNKAINIDIELRYHTLNIIIKKDPTALETAKNTIKNITTTLLTSLAKYPLISLGTALMVRFI